MLVMAVFFVTKAMLHGYLEYQGVWKKLAQGVSSGSGRSILVHVFPGKYSLGTTTKIANSR